MILDFVFGGLTRWQIVEMHLDNDNMTHETQTYKKELGYYLFLSKFILEIVTQYDNVSNSEN